MAPCQRHASTCCPQRAGLRKTAELRVSAPTSQPRSHWPTTSNRMWDSPMHQGIRQRDRVHAAAPEKPDEGPPRACCRHMVSECGVCHRCRLWKTLRTRIHYLCMHCIGLMEAPHRHGCQHDHSAPSAVHTALHALDLTQNSISRLAFCRINPAWRSSSLARRDTIWPHWAAPRLSHASARLFGRALILEKLPLLKPCGDDSVMRMAPSASGSSSPPCSTSAGSPIAKPTRGTGL